MTLPGTSTHDPKRTISGRAWPMHIHESKAYA